MINDILIKMSAMLREGSAIAPLIALLAGFLTSLTPCSMSSIPLVIGYVGGTGQDDTKRSFKLSLTFALGMTITFTVIGLVSSLMGRMVSATGRWWYIILGVLMVLMAIQTWDIYYFIHPTHLMNKSTSKGYKGALVSGLLGGLFSSPCATPVMIALMTMIVSGGGNILWGILLFLLYALGHSIIVIIAGTFVGFVTKLNSSQGYGKIAKVIQFVLGLLILILGIYMISLGI